MVNCKNKIKFTKKRKYFIFNNGRPLFYLSIKKLIQKNILYNRIDWIKLYNNKMFDFNYMISIVNIQQ